MRSSRNSLHNELRIGLVSHPLAAIIVGGAVSVWAAGVAASAVEVRLQSLHHSSKLVQIKFPCEFQTEQPPHSCMNTCRISLRIDFTEFSFVWQLAPYVFRSLFGKREKTHIRGGSAYEERLRTYISLPAFYVDLLWFMHLWWELETSEGIFLHHSKGPGKKTGFSSFACCHLKEKGNCMQEILQMSFWDMTDETPITIQKSKNIENNWDVPFPLH